MFIIVATNDRECQHDINHKTFLSQSYRELLADNSKMSAGILLNKICTGEVARGFLLSHEKKSLNKQINSVKFWKVDFA